MRPPFIGLALSLAIVLLLILAPEQIAFPPQSAWHTAEKLPHSFPETLPETFPPEEDLALPGTSPSPAGEVRERPVSSQVRPKVALLIDDMGYNRIIGQKLLSLQLPLNFSFLPQAPYTRELADLAQRQQRTILVHMPMEPQSTKWKEEPITLQTRDSAQELKKKVEAMLAAVPQASGANNHMGSRFTQKREKMETVLRIIQRRQLFFVDSYTSGSSLGQSTASSLGIPTARRRVFLDNEQTVEAICAQLHTVATLAHQEQSAIAIGHPNRAMATALATCAQEHLAHVDLVSLEELVQ